MFDNTLSKSVISASVANSTTKLFDSYSYNLAYDFLGNSGGEVVYKFSEPYIQIKKDSILGLHIYGDLSGNEIYLTLSTLSGVFDVKLDSLHYNGWKFAEKLIGNAVPEDYTFNLIGLKIVQTSAPLSNKGSIFIDNLLIYNKILSYTSSPNIKNLKIYPNPAKNIIKIERNTNQNIKSVKLFSISGQIIKELSKENINVSDISNGTYILKITFEDGIVTTPIIIKK